MDTAELIEYGRQIDERYVGDFMLQEPDGSTRIIGNVEMHALAAYCRYRNEWQRLTDRWCESFLAWLDAMSAQAKPVAHGYTGSTDHSSDVLHTSRTEE